MPIISSTSPATANPTPPKNDTIKPIGICLPTSTNIEIPVVSTAAAAAVANLPTGPRNSLNNNSQTNSNSFYPSTTTVSTPGQFQMGPLSVMVAKFTPANQSIASNRQQTVILQPRINTTRAATALQMNPIRGSTVLSSQSLSTALTSTTSSISVRTRVLTGQNHQANALPMLNLSAVTNPVVSANSASASNTTVKQVIKGPKLLSSTNNLETVNLVMTTPSDVRNVRTNLNSNDIKANMLTVHNISNNKMNGPKTVLPGGSTLVAQPKMISINNTGQSTTNICQRLGILGTGVGGGKSGIINLTTATIAKSIIFTAPNATLTGTGSTLANMVNISSANNFVPTGQPTKISVTPNHIIASGPRPHLVSTTTGTLPPNHNNLLSPKATIYTVATTSANVMNSVSSLPSTTISTVPQVVSYSSSISSTTVTLSTSSVSTASLVNVKPTILATNLSPVKPPYLQPPTHHQANSPRPRILSRKRINSDQTSTITLKTANGTTLSHPSCNNNAPSSVLNIDPKLLPCLSTLTDGQLKSESASNVTIPLNAVAASTAVPDIISILPRKKPRKQLLEPSSSPKKEFECDYPIVRDLDVEKETKEKVFYIKRPRPVLRETKHSPYHSASKSTHSLLPHFLHYKDVKPKPDKKVSFTDLLGEVTKPHVGWKINHIAQQLQESSNEEVNTMQNTLDNFLTVLEKDISPFSSCASNTTLFGDANASKLDAVDKISVKINDLTRANLQRTRVILDHYKESKQLLLKLTTEHKDKVTGLAKRIGHKRGFVK